jgi:hypothetical protein
MLGVIPHGGDGVAVIIAHDLALGAECAGRTLGSLAGVGGEKVHGEIVVGRLLGGVAVVLRLRGRLGAVEAEGAAASAPLAALVLFGLLSIRPALASVLMSVGVLSAALNSGSPATFAALG